MVTVRLALHTARTQPSEALRKVLGWGLLGLAEASCSAASPCCSCYAPGRLQSASCVSLGQERAAGSLQWQLLLKLTCWHTCAVALEAGAEGDLPHAVSPRHASLGLNVGQHIPARAQGLSAYAVCLVALCTASLQAACLASLHRQPDTGFELVLPAKLLYQMEGLSTLCSCFSRSGPTLHAAPSSVGSAEAVRQVGVSLRRQLDSTLRLQSRSLASRDAPDGGGRRVAVAVQGGLGGLHEGLRQLQLLLDLVDHAPAPCVDAEVLEGRLEVGHVRLHLHAQHLRRARQRQHKLRRSDSFEWCQLLSTAGAVGAGCSKLEHTALSTAIRPCT